MQMIEAAKHKKIQTIGNHFKKLFIPRPLLD